MRINDDGDGLIYSGVGRTVVFRVNGKDVLIEIPAYYCWDGASIPFFAQWFVGKPLEELFRMASFIHDLTYERREFRVLCDVLFYYILRRRGVAKWKAMLMYASVRVGGHAFYAGDTSRFWRAVRWLLQKT